MLSVECLFWLGFCLRFGWAFNFAFISGGGRLRSQFIFLFPLHVSYVVFWGGWGLGVIVEASFLPSFLGRGLCFGLIFSFMFGHFQKLYLRTGS